MSDAHALTTTGDLVRLVCLAAEDHDVDVIVVGSPDKSALRRLIDPSVAVEIVRERTVQFSSSSASRRTTLEGWFAGHLPLVATSSRTDFHAALAEVRDDLVRQISDAKNRTEPKNNRAVRDGFMRAG